MGRPILRLVVLSIALVLGGAACSAGGHASSRQSANVTVVTTTTVGLSPGESLPPVTSASSGSGAGATTTSVPAGDHGPQQFRLPSGNIGCAVDATVVRCDIGQRDWVAPPKPADCQLDYGNGISLDANGAVIACAGDTVLGASDVLGYGQSAQRGPFFCVSSQAGVTCKDADNGHGFDLSRQAYKLY
jgi:hypothetical protein